MTLRRKITVVVAVALVVGCAALSLVVGSLLAARHREYEEVAMRRSLTQAEAAVGERLASLQMTVDEWASWESSAAFMVDRDAAFLDRSFSPEALSGLRLTLVAFFDPAGTVLAMRSTDGRGADLAKTLSRVIATRHEARTGTRPVPFGGITEVRDRLLLTAVSPVAPGRGAGSARGFLAFARRMDGRELQAVGDEAGSRVTIGHRSLSLDPGEPVIRFSDDLVEGYALLPSLSGGDEMVLGVERSRESISQRFPAGPIIAIIVIMTLCSGGGLFIIDRLVLLRLARLAAEVGPEGFSGGGDELDILATKLSGALDDLNRFTADLQESEARWRMMVENAPLAIGVAVNGNIRFLNAAGLKILAVNSLDEVLGRPILEFVHPDYRAIVGERIGRVVTSGFLVPTIEEQFIRADGQQITVGVTAAPVTYRGSPAVLVMFRDVSARKRADEELTRYREQLEQMVGERTASLTVANERLLREVKERERAEAALRESEELYRTLVATAPVAVSMADASGRVVFASERSLALLGYKSFEEVAGSHFLDTVAPGGRERVAGYIGRLLTEGTICDELPMLRADGTTVEVEVNASLVLDETGAPKAIIGTFLDLTLRREADRLLRESEQLHRTLVASAPVAVVRCDAQGRLTFVSPRSRELFRIPEGSEIIGRMAAEFVAPAYRERMLERLQSALQADLSLANEYTLLRADGTVFEALVSTGSFRDTDGRPVGLVLTFTDVTERRRVQRERELAGDRLAALEILGQMAGASDRELADFAVEEAVRLTGSTVGYLAFSHESEGTIEMYIWSKQAMAECATSETPRIYRLEETGLWGEAIRQGRPVITNDYAAPNLLKKGVPEGHVPIVRHMNVPVRDEGRIVLIAGVANKPEDYDDEDVRQLGLLMDGMWRLMAARRSRQALQDSEERNRVIVENAPIGVMIHRAGTLLYNNELSETLFGYGGETGVHGMAVMGQIHPDDRSMVEQRRRQRRADAGAASDSYTVRMICRDGAMKHVRVGVGPIRFRGEMATMVTLTDVTDRVRAEEGLQKALGRLEAQNLELTRLDRLKDGLVRDVTHELKTPVAKLRMQLELLEQAIARSGGSQVASPAIFVMRESLLRQESVIRNILNLARLESGGRKYELAPARVDTLLEEVVEDFRFALDAHGIIVERDLGPVVATTDREMLSHVFSNLLGNAIKYRSHERPPAIFLGMRVAGGDLVVTVMDNGIGMTGEEIALAFDRFWQASAAAEGAGVGLSIAQRVVTDLGGTIELCSRGRDLGTVATVTLPMRGTNGRSEKEG